MAYKKQIKGVMTALTLKQIYEYPDQSITSTAGVCRCSKGTNWVYKTPINSPFPEDTYRQADISDLHKQIKELARAYHIRVPRGFGKIVPIEIPGLKHHRNVITQIAHHVADTGKPTTILFRHQYRARENGSFNSAITGILRVNALCKLQRSDARDKGRHKKQAEGLQKTLADSERKVAELLVERDKLKEMVETMQRSQSKPN